MAQPTPKNNLWKAALQSDYSLVVMLPGSYRLVKPAGKGATAQVFLCLPRNSDAPKSSGFARSSSPDMKALKSQLVAVKVRNNRWRFNTNKIEVPILKYITEKTTKENGGRWCQQLVTSDPKLRWIASSAVFGSLALADLPNLFWTQKPLQLLPETMVWHFYIQLTEALTFLHTTCDPPIAHGDLHMNNILVDLENYDHSGFPNIVIIDFGISKQGSITSPVGLISVNEWAKKDLYHFYANLLALVHKAVRLDCAAWNESEICGGVTDDSFLGPCEHSESWIEFARTMQEGRVRKLNQDISTSRPQLQGVWDRFGDVAMRNRANISSGELAKMRKVLGNRIREENEDIKGRIRQVVGN